MDGPMQLSISSAEAAARLRYLDGIQGRTRRAALAPWHAFVALGTLILVHATLATVWPHAVAASITWTAGTIAIYPVLRRLRHGIEEQRGVRGPVRLRLRCTGAALATAWLAVTLGANSLISAIAVATALPAYLAGLPGVAVAAVLVGAVGDTVAAQHLAPQAGHLVFGTGLLVLGLVSRVRERELA